MAKNFSLDAIAHYLLILSLKKSLKTTIWVLSNFVGTSKKARYKKLVVEKSEIVKNIMKLNLEIKWSHELIAAEISDFLKFRTEFLRFGIKRYISEEIKLLKQRSTELSKYVF